MPYFHFYATFSVFYIFPFVFVLINVWAVITTDLNKSWLGPYFALFTIVALPLIFWYDNTIYVICLTLKDQREDGLKADEDD